MLSSPSAQRKNEPAERLKASVIIPTYNRKETLRQVLQFYLLQDHSKESFELIIVDDGSMDGTATLFDGLKDMDIDHSNPVLRKHARRILSASHGFYYTGVGDTEISESNTGAGPVYVKFIQIAKSGRSIARNIGVNIAHYPLIIFADDDIFVEPSFIKKHIECHDVVDNRVIMGTVVHTKNLENPLNARWKLKDINTAFLATGNASVLKEHLIGAGGFDEGYNVYGWEDFDLGIHLKENGLKSVKRKIFGYHYDPPQRFVQPQSTYYKEKERGFSAAYFYRNHPLSWVKRFTLINNRILQTLVRVVGYRNWFLSKRRIYHFRGLLRVLIRYKGYFDGVEEGKKQYKVNL